MEGRNSLTGSIIPRELANLSTLQSLDLSSSFLIGPIPLEFGNLYELQYFDISDNLMSGSIPSELGALSQLVNMNLGRKQKCFLLLWRHSCSQSSD